MRRHQHNHAPECFGPAVDEWGVCQNCFQVIDPDRRPRVPDLGRGPIKVRWRERDGDLPQTRRADHGLSEHGPNQAAAWEREDR